ncbi:hypothetical protein DR864_09365 [Runella rosea]|uniref:Uncharacterized protein n=1 Tax=Runella rosea TaxID=2259595 RepID=A0A344TH06_9BACT|nr:hypothetical protein [Runella rosea]AXE17927.1 hypothetical protein DR864_09365 [Runella rosea]
MASLPSKLQWVNGAFSRVTQLIDGKKVVGELKRELFSSDVIARLNDTTLRFDVRGFLKKQVDVYDHNNTIIAVIELHMGRTATLHLNGETYIFKKNGFLSREWSLIHDLPDTEQDPEVIHYTAVRTFFKKEGELALLEPSPESDVLILTGLFLRNYFVRRQAKKAAVIGAIS